jgi:DNA-binding beta-propeller fold protein YncE
LTVGDYPRAIFVNTNNTIYVAHGQNNQILVWNEESINPTKIVSGNFTQPASLFVTSNGNIYIDDGGSNRRVQRWISTTNTSETVLNVNSSCMGLFVDIKDNLYCSMLGHHLVVKRSLNNTEMTTVTVAGTGIAGSASNQLRFPYGNFVDVNLDLYVADCGNDRVQLIKREQSYGITVAGSTSLYPTITLSCPSGVSLDASKYLFIVDQGNHRIVGSSPNGFRCIVGCYGYGSKSNQLNTPFSFSFDRSGNMLVIDQINQRIQKFIYLEKSCGKLNKMMKWEFR